MEQETDVKSRVVKGKCPQCGKEFEDLLEIGLEYPEDWSAPIVWCPDGCITIWQPRDVSVKVMVKPERLIEMLRNAKIKSRGTEDRTIKEALEKGWEPCSIKEAKTRWADIIVENDMTEHLMDVLLESVSDERLFESLVIPIYNQDAVEFLDSLYEERED